MYTVICKYNLLPGKKEEFIQDVQAHLISLLNHTPGFRAYTLLEVGDNEVVGISSFNTLADANALGQLVMKWHAEHAEAYLQGVARLTGGLVRVQSVSSGIPPTNSENLLQGVF